MSAAKTNVLVFVTFTVGRPYQRPHSLGRNMRKELKEARRASSMFRLHSKSLPLISLHALAKSRVSRLLRANVPTLLLSDCPVALEQGAELDQHPQTRFEDLSPSG